MVGQLPPSLQFSMCRLPVPDAVGGAEIHVAALIGALQARGIEGAIAAPGDCEQEYAHDGLPFSAAD